MLGNRTGQQLRLADLFPTDHLFATGLDNRLHPINEVDVIELVCAGCFVTPDVDVRPGRQRCQFADDILQEGVGNILGSAQGNIRTGRAGVELWRDPIAGQFGVGGQGGIDMARHIDFRDHRDVAAFGIIHNICVVILAVVSARRTAHFQAAPING